LFGLSSFWLNCLVETLKVIWGFFYLYLQNKGATALHSEGFSNWLLSVAKE